MPVSLRPPVLLCLAGHDPTGGAGIVADLQAAAAQGVHALTVITALTVQDSHNVREVHAIDLDLLRSQLDLLLADCRVAAIKVGLIGSAAQIPLIVELIKRCGAPAVLDPVLRAGGGQDLASADLQSALLRDLLPRVHLLTPNAAEARRLAARDDLDEAAELLMQRGAANLLITGGDEAGSQVCNRWYAPEQPLRQWTWTRLPDTFHGAGCTLASAIAARLALGEPLAEALEQAQAWTQRSLSRAYAIGRGRLIPDRTSLRGGSRPIAGA